jgi:hypothetical protein
VNQRAINVSDGVADLGIKGLDERSQLHGKSIA